MKANGIDLRILKISSLNGQPAFTVGADFKLVVIA